MTNCKKRILPVVLAILLLIAAGWFGIKVWLGRYIPPADRSDIGKTVTVSLRELQEENPYRGDLDPEMMDHLSFVYVYDSQACKGRLTVFTRCADPRYCCVTVFEPEWTGSEGLCQHLTGSFSAKVIARKNITGKDGLFLAHNLTKYTGGTAQFIHVASHREISSPNVLWYLGVLDPTPQSTLWDTLDNGLCVSLKVASGNPSGQTDVRAFMDLLDRYRLDSVLYPDGE